MQGKITLITPPDIFENESQSLLFMHLDEEDQETVSKWLAKSNIDKDINIYFYDHEIDLPWLLHAVARSDHVLINLDEVNDVTKVISGYLAGKKKVSWKTKNESTAAIYHFINQNRITNIEKFLERAFDVQDRSEPSV